MCNHTYQWENKRRSCTLQTLIELPLPIDIDGFCVFHSTDRAWKYDNDCFNYFVELIGQSNSKSQALHLHGIHMTGLTAEQHQEKEMFGDKAACLFTSGIIKNDFVLFDCVFYDDVYLENMRFVGEVALSKCEFKGDFEVKMNSVFREDFDTDGCVFHKLFALDNGTSVHGPSQICQSTFHGSMDLDAVTFHSPLYLSDITCTTDDKVIDFTGSRFKMGLSIIDGNYKGLLNFFECEFHGENMIRNLPYHADFTIAGSQFYGSLLLQGTADRCLFGPNSILDIHHDQFHNSARITFDYCDMLNLNDEFISIVKDLEELQLIKINETCRTNRFKHKVVFNCREINHEVIEDYTRVVSRYFSRLHATMLSVSYRRLLDKPQLEVIYSSDENMEDDFHEKLEEGLKAIHIGHDQIDGDLSFQLKAILARLSRKQHSGDIETKDVGELLSLMTDYKLSINMIMGNNYNIKQHNSGNHVTQSITTGDINSQKVAELSELAKAATEELTNKGFTPDQLKQAASIIDEMIERYGNGEVLDASWKERLLGATGSLASIGSLLQGLGIG